MSRRWEKGWRQKIAGIDFRTASGDKAPGDLRMEWRTSTGWQPIPMSVLFLLADFFGDNEDHLTTFRPHWREPGAEYFLKALTQAVLKGWETATKRLREQTTKLEQAKELEAIRETPATLELEQLEEVRAARTVEYACSKCGSVLQAAEPLLDPRWGRGFCLECARRQDGQRTG